MKNSVVQVIVQLQVPWCKYLLTGIALQIITRLVMAGFSTSQLPLITDKQGLRVYTESILKLYGRCIVGRFPGDEKQSDLGLPALIGLLELWFYPLLLATDVTVVNGPNIIGAWIGLKTVAQWNRWKEDRPSFHRYLFGNALIVLFSICIAALYLRQ
jgi:hypothetical protein